MTNSVKKRIGVHVGTAGGTWTAVERAVAAGANTFQIFSSSPRQWRAAVVKPADAVKMRELRAKASDRAIHKAFVKVKFADFELISRSRTLVGTISSRNEFGGHAVKRT